MPLCSPPFLLLLLVPGICWPTFGHYTLILHSLGFYINKLTNYILLCLWFLSLSMMKNHYGMFVSGYLPWRRSDNSEVLPAKVDCLYYLNGTSEQLGFSEAWVTGFAPIILLNIKMCIYTNMIELRRVFK